jgi:putative hemolysin
MTGLTLEILFIFALLLANGLFAMAEIAVVASRKARLKNMSDEGHPGARLALALADSPGKFLSTVQVGITFVGVLASALGGANIAEKLASAISRSPSANSSRSASPSTTPSALPPPSPAP